MTEKCESISKVETSRNLTIFLLISFFERCKPHAPAGRQKILKTYRLKLNRQ